MIPTSLSSLLSLVPVVIFANDRFAENGSVQIASSQKSKEVRSSLRCWHQWRIPAATGKEEGDDLEFVIFDTETTVPATSIIEFGAILLHSTRTLANFLSM